MGERKGDVPLCVMECSRFAEDDPIFVGAIVRVEGLSAPSFRIVDLYANETRALVTAYVPERGERDD